MKRDLLTILDVSVEEIEALLQRATLLKERLKKGELDASLAGKTLGLLFDKPSTRTRVSFEVAMYQLGGHVLFMSSKETQLSRDESLRDTALVLSRYIDGLVVRTYADESLRELASHAEIPVINGLTDLYHPCQVLGDILTVREKKGDLDSLKVAWVGDGNNVAHSWINAAVRLPFQLSLACPSGYEPRKDILQRAQESAGDRIHLSADPADAVSNADVINTDVWTSMGQEEERQKRLAAFRDFQINNELVRKAKSDVIVMHCLPAHRGEEITDGVMDGPNSVVFDQAENRMHLQRALLDWLLGSQG
ncbi:MAG: ornithine carbamoyltransferase [Deltaproteobacteria bacterium]|jgi:ornithine carbamoyltransferase|nr:MAG: ornithine carbamoyltransferase [Deltaproteobacteria bacterium]